MWIETVAREWQQHGSRAASKVLALLAGRIDKRLPRSWFQRIAERLRASHGLTFVDDARRKRRLRLLGWELVEV